MTRYLVVGGLVGVWAASLSGSDAIGFLAGGLAALALYAATRAFPNRLGGGSCALPDQAQQAPRSSANSTTSTEHEPVTDRPPVDQSTQSDAVR